MKKSFCKLCTLPNGPLSPKGTGCKCTRLAYFMGDDVTEASVSGTNGRRRRRKPKTITRRRFELLHGIITTTPALPSGFYTTSSSSGGVVKSKRPAQPTSKKQFKPKKRLFFNQYPEGFGSRPKVKQTNVNTSCLTESSDDFRVVFEKRVTFSRVVVTHTYPSDGGYCTRKTGGYGVVDLVPNKKNHMLSVEDVAFLERPCSFGCTLEHGSVPGDGYCGYHALVVVAGIKSCGHRFCIWWMINKKRFIQTGICAMPSGSTSHTQLWADDASLYKLAWCIGTNVTLDSEGFATTTGEWLGASGQHLVLRSHHWIPVERPPTDRPSHYTEFDPRPDGCVPLYLPSLRQGYRYMAPGEISPIGATVLSDFVTGVNMLQISTSAPTNTLPGVTSGEAEGQISLPPAVDAAVAAVELGTDFEVSVIPSSSRPTTPDSWDDSSCQADDEGVFSYENTPPTTPPPFLSEQTIVPFDWDPEEHSSHFALVRRRVTGPKFSIDSDSSDLSEGVSPTPRTSYTSNWHGPLQSRFQKLRNYFTSSLFLIQMTLLSLIGPFRRGYKSFAAKSKSFSNWTCGRVFKIKGALQASSNTSEDPKTSDSPVITNGSLGFGFDFSLVFPGGVSGAISSCQYTLQSAISRLNKDWGPFLHVVLTMLAGKLVGLPIHIMCTLAFVSVAWQHDPLVLLPIPILAKIFCWPDLAAAVVYYLVTLGLFGRDVHDWFTPKHSSWKRWRQQIWKPAIAAAIIAFFVLPVPYTLHSLLPWGGKIVPYGYTGAIHGSVDLHNGYALIPTWPYINALAVFQEVLSYLLSPLLLLGPMVGILLAIVVLSAQYINPHWRCHNVSWFDFRCAKCCTKEKQLRFFGHCFTCQSDAFCDEHRFGCLNRMSGHRAPPPALRIALSTPGAYSDHWVNFMDCAPTGVLPSVNNISSWRPQTGVVYAVNTDFDLTLVSALSYVYGVSVDCTRWHTRPKSGPTTRVNEVGLEVYKQLIKAPGYRSIPTPTLAQDGSFTFNVGSEREFNIKGVVQCAGDTFCMYGLFPTGYSPTHSELEVLREHKLSPSTYDNPRPLAAEIWVRHTSFVQSDWVRRGYTGFVSTPTTEAEVQCDQFCWRTFRPSDLSIDQNTCKLTSPRAFKGCTVQALFFDGMRPVLDSNPFEALKVAKLTTRESVNVALTAPANVSVVPECYTKPIKERVLSEVQSCNLTGAFAIPELASLRAVPPGVTHPTPTESTLVLSYDAGLWTFSGDISSPGQIWIKTTSNLFVPEAEICIEQALGFKARAAVALVLLALAGVLHLTLFNWERSIDMGNWDGFFLGTVHPLTVTSGIPFIAIPTVMALGAVCWFGVSKACGFWSDIQVCALAYLLMICTCLMPRLSLPVTFAFCLIGFCNAKFASLAALSMTMWLPLGPGIALVLAMFYLKATVFAFGVTNMPFNQAAMRNWYLTPTIAQMLMEATNTDIAKLTAYAVTSGPTATLAQELIGVLCDHTPRKYSCPNFMVHQSRENITISPLKNRVVVISSSYGSGHGFVRSAANGVCHVTTVRHVLPSNTGSATLTCGGVSLEIVNHVTVGELVKLECKGNLGTLPAMAESRMCVGSPVEYHSLTGSFNLYVARTNVPTPVGATVAGDSGTVITQKGSGGEHVIVGYHQGVVGAFAAYVNPAGVVCPPLSDTPTSLTDDNIPVEWIGNDSSVVRKSWISCRNVSAVGKHELSSLEAVLSDSGARTAQQTGMLPLGEGWTIFTILFSLFGLLTLKRTLSKTVPCWYRAISCCVMATAFNALFFASAGVVVTSAAAFTAEPATQAFALEASYTTALSLTMCVSLFWMIAGVVSTSVKSLGIVAFATALATSWKGYFTLALIPGTCLHPVLDFSIVGMCLCVDLLVRSGKLWPLKYINFFMTPVCLLPKVRTLPYGTFGHLPAGCSIVYQSDEDSLSELLNEAQLTMELALEGETVPVKLLHTLVNALAAYCGLNDGWVTPPVEAYGVVQSSDDIDRLSTKDLEVLAADPEKGKAARKALARRAAFTAMMESRLAAAARTASKDTLSSEIVPRIWGALKSTLSKVTSLTTDRYIIKLTLDEVQEEAAKLGVILVDYASVPSLGCCIGRYTLPPVFLSSSSEDDTTEPGPVTNQLDDSRRLMSKIKRLPRQEGNTGFCDFYVGSKMVGTTSKSHPDNYVEVRTRGTSYFANPDHVQDLLGFVAQSDTSSVFR
ncbi:1A [Wuhan japanese halfbeak arterivirus]|uniref:1A n=1 Tax=Wuhan japanese halfbeak arterivirus TaxID=2116443 RepID=A0A2P1GMW1_9NIDO|nr:1A [Wuhan japanese halfbeak arterivirus]AVM87310.1 1A [Wuhan japanese halfbeak arterivirus]